jgi:iron complex transport system permease protein
MDPRQKQKTWKYILLLSFLGLLLLCLIAAALGPSRITLSQSAGIVLSRIPFFQRWFLRQLSLCPANHIIWSLRLPRVILAVLSGGALGMAGGAFQAFFKNPMADTYVIGVSSGAALGATLGIVSGAGGILGIFEIPLFSFSGALLSTLLVYSLARSGKKVVVFTLLLAGVALSSFMSSVMSFLMVMHADSIDKVFMWLMGSFANRTWQHVGVAAPLIAVGAAVLLVLAKDLNALVFGDSTAQHLGVDLARLHWLILVAASLSAAGAVAVCGTIGFVGLIVPHAARILVGPDHRILLPFSFFLGGAFMLAADTAARTFFAPMEIPVGIITALIGAPFFIYLLKKNKSKSF